MVPNERSFDPKLRTFVLGFLGVTFSAGLIWRFTPLYHRLNFHEVAQWLENLQGHLWTIPAMMLLFIFAGFILFMHVVMLWATVLTFDPWHAVLYCELGSLASATVLYGCGRILRPDVIRKLAGSYLGKVSQALGRRGKTTLVLLHWFPICPFSVLNLLSGSTHIGFWDFVVGTVIGVTPGIFFISFFGEGVRRSLHHPHWESFAALAAFVVVGFFVLRRARRRWGVADSAR